jgi:hypothetical protein
MDALFGVSTGFFWPTTLGLVSEQFPRGGALTLNAIGAAGMTSVGNPSLAPCGMRRPTETWGRTRPALHAAVAEPAQQQLGFDFQPLDGAKINSLSSRDKAHVEIIIAKTNQAILAKIVILPSIMFLYFLNLGLFFRRRAGYRQVELVRAREEGE